MNNKLVTPFSVGIILLLSLFVTLPALAGFVAPTRFLPGDSAITTAANTQSSPGIAQGGGLTLIAWGDARPSSTGVDADTGQDIYAMRLDASGNLLDTTPFIVNSGPASQVNPKVAWNGSNFLVVYETNTVSGTGSYYQKGFEAVRVNAQGQVLDTNPIPLHGLIPSGPSYWSLASDGNQWVLATQTTSTSGDIVGVRISPDGVVLDPPTRTLVDATYYMRSNFHLAYAGGVFLFTFNDAYLNGTYDTKYTRFDSNLTWLDAQPVQILTVPASGLTAFGSNFFLTWNQQQLNGSNAVYASRLNTSAQKLDGAGDNLSGNLFPPLTEINAAWDGIQWKVIWLKDGSLYLGRVSANGAILDPGGISVSGPLSGPTIGTGTGGIQTVWSPYINGDQSVITANIPASNTPGPNIPVSIGAPLQMSPDTATSGSGYMLVYRSSTGIDNRVLAQPMDANGDPTTAEPVLLDTGDVLSGNPGSISVAWNGSLYLATWANASGVVAQRLSPDGSKLDPAPFLVMASSFGSTDVEALNGTFLVAGRRCGINCQYIDIVTARVSSAGVVLDPSPIALGAIFASSPRVVVLGGRWLVALQNNFSHDDSNAVTYGIFINADGTKTALFSIHSGYSTAGGNGIFSLGLASNGSVALLAQSQELTSGVETDLLFRLINADGSVQLMVNLTPWRGNQFSPRVAWDGTNFVLVYQDQKNGFSDLEMLDARSDLFGMRISPTGTVIDPQGFVFSSSPESETRPSVIAQNGVSLISAAIMRNQAPYANYRIGFGLFGVGGNQWPVTVASASPSGGDVPLNVAFSSVGSSDLDGSISSYSWDFGDGGTSNTANPSHTYTTGGPFVVHLTVTDNGGATSTQAILVTATLPNQLPIAVAAASPLSGPAPLSVIFYADGSYDPDGPIGNIQWQFHDGSTYWGSPAYYTYNQNGSFPVTLTVYDSRGATGTTTITINVGTANQPPVAAASASPTGGDAPLAVAFSSAGSSDPDGTIVSYLWNFADGATSTEANPAHTFTSPGVYAVLLTVTDNLGATGSAQVSVNVTGGCTTSCLRSSAITLSARLRGGVVTAGGKVTVNNELGIAIRGATVSVTWTLPGGGSLNQQANTNSRGLASFSATGTTGTYTLTVTNITKTGYTFDPANSVLSKSITR